MNTLMPDEPCDDIASDVAGSFCYDTRNLTQQELERGLSALLLAVQRQSLPLVVLVEDDDTEAQFFRGALRATGIAVSFMHFRDGGQATDFFFGNGVYSDRTRYPLPHLTVLDVKLVQGSGLQILREIRARPHLEQLVVVALTGSEDIREIEQARSLQINDWINKPNRANELVKIVGGLLRTWLPLSP